MAKKDFNEIETGNIFADTITEATAELVEPPLERQKQGQLPTKAFVDEARRQGRTQGRAGCTSNRINMAFKPDVYQFIQAMSRARGETMTSFVNHIIEKSMEQYNEEYQQVLRFREIL